MAKVGEGGGWVGLGRGLHRWQAPTASVSFPHRLDWALPRLSGLTALQTADDPRTPPRRWWEGDAAVPVCPRAPGSLGGGGLSRQGHTCVVLQQAVVGACGGLCVPGAPGPSSGAWVPYHEAAEGVCGLGDQQLPPAYD